MFNRWLRGSPRRGFMISPRGSRRVQLTISEVMVVVAAVAVGCAWPVLLMPTGAGGLGLFLHKFGFSLRESLVIAAILGVLLGFCIPPVGSNCRRGGTAPGSPPLNPVLQQTRPATG